MPDPAPNAPEPLVSTHKPRPPMTATCTADERPVTYTVDPSPDHVRSIAAAAVDRWQAGEDVEDVIADYTPGQIMLCLAYLATKEHR